MTIEWYWHHIDDIHTVNVGISSHPAREVRATPNARFPLTGGPCIQANTSDIWSLACTIYELVIRREVIPLCASEHALEQDGDTLWGSASGVERVSRERLRSLCE